MATKSKSSGTKSTSKGVAKASAAAVVPQLFRATLEVSHLERARAFYEALLGIAGRKLSGTRVQFDCGSAVLELADVSASGPSNPSAGPMYFSVPSLEAVHKRAKKLKCLSIQLVHEKPGGTMVVRPSGERTFYADDPWFNGLCFVEAGAGDKA